MDINTLIQALSISPSTMFFGNSLSQYLMLLLTILGFIILSKVVYYIFKTYVRKIVEKTETELDDILLEIVERPIMVLVIVLGVYLGNLLFLNPGTYVHDLLHNIVKILIIIDIAWLALRVLDAFLVHFMQPYVEKSDSKLDDQLLPILRKGLKIVVIVFTIIFILSNFGYDVTALIAGLGVGSLAIALAAQDTISNFIGSILIFTGKPFKIGDFIKFGNFAGTVHEVSLRTTKFETPTGTKLVVPNSKLSADIIENFTDVKTRRVDQVIGLTYSTSYKKLLKAMKLLEKTVMSHPNISKCDIKFMEFGAYSLNISVWYWLKDATKYRDTINEVNLEIKKVFDKEGIEMAFPTQTLYINK